jgi:hypothetical protein
MIVEGIAYEIFVASDVDRDSMQLECYRGSGNQRELLVEVVRYDGQKRYAFVQYVPEVPLALVEHLAAIARKELGPFFVG